MARAVIDFDQHIGIFVFGGIGLLAMTLLPARFESRPLSLPMLYVAFGYVAFRFLPQLTGPDPIGSGRDLVVVEHGTELIVIVSLAGAGLKLDRRLGLVSWSSVWRLLSVGMTLTVVATIALGYYGLGLGLAASILLGAVLAPTDPVLADAVKVDDLGGDVDDEVRFTLTAEAGLNDALAFPITYLAIGVAAAGTFTGAAAEWLAIDVGYRLVAGAACGWLFGRGLSWFARRFAPFDHSDTNEGLFVLGSTILVYGLTELVNGYGFLAVFVAALTRDGGEYRERVSSFADHMERMLLAFVLLAFGALLSEGVLDDVTLVEAGVAVVLVAIVRPLSGLLALLGSSIPAAERMAIAFFGIRGMGSIYYLAYASDDGAFDAFELTPLWRVTSLTIVISIIVHGIAASPVMRIVDRRNGRRRARTDTVRDGPILDDPILEGGT